MTRFFSRYIGIGRFRSRRMKAGFTLVELLVVTGIVIIISGTVLVNNTKFGGSVLLQNFAYDLALSIREAQIFGIAVRRSADGTFGAGFGMHFDISTQNGQKTYSLFADIYPTPSGNESYDSSEGELMETSTILRGYKIIALCTKATSGSAWSCAGNSSLDIVFKRPEPDAYIHVNGGGTLQSSARIVLASPQNDQINVMVGSNGQITVSRLTAADKI